MKPLPILCLALLLSSSGALAQGPAGQKPLFDFRKKKVDDETKSKAVDAAKSIIKAVPDEVKERAKEVLTSPESAEMRQKALQAAQTIIQGQNNTSSSTPASPAPASSTNMPDSIAPAKPSPAVAVVETPPSTGPQPKPLQPLNLDEAPKATKGQIDITAQRSSFFDANKSYGIFNGNVKARHPQMYIECEELEIYMTKQEGGGVLGSKPKTQSKDSDILAPAKKAGNEAPPIDRADARGPMVTVEKLTESGELQIGHCKHLIYDGKTGGTTLLEWPQVQAGNKLHKSTEPGCIMVIDQKGMLTTTGGHETIILQGDDATPKSRGGIAPSGQ